MEPRDKLAFGAGNLHFTLWVEDKLESRWRGNRVLFPRGYLMNLSYYMYETAHWLLGPARAASGATRTLLEFPGNPLTHTRYGRTVTAACELFERTTRRYGKPGFGLDDHAGRRRRSRRHRACRLGAPLLPSDLLRPRHCAGPSAQPKLLIVAPMSGHYATLAARHRRAFLPTHRGFHHRLGRCPHGAAGRGLVRSRRLYRLPDRHVPRPSGPICT